MSDFSFEYDREKAVEAILFISNRAVEPTLHNITHLLYFADKISLEKHGRFICGDDYFAMEHGPVPIRTYRLLKRGENTDEFGFLTEGIDVVPLREPDLDRFSESDIESMTAALDDFGDASFGEVKDESHDDAYEAAWAVRGNMKISRIPIESITALLEDSDQLLSFVENRHAE